MAVKDEDLGRLITVYGIAPAYVQRAAFLAVLSFLFFLAMMFAFYAIQSFLYFLLSTAFLIVYLITMISFIWQRRRSVEVFEHGLKFRKTNLLWNEILSVADNGEIARANGKNLIIPATITNFDNLIRLIKDRSIHRP